MNKIIQALKSRTVWVLVFTFVFNGFDAISGALSPEVVLVVNAFLGMLATYFKIHPSQDYR